MGTSLQQIGPAVGVAAVEPDDGDGSTGDIELVPLARIQVGGTIRRRPDFGQPTSRNHRTDPAAWSPIVVSRRTGSVIDGHRRVRAARGRGWTAIAARWFDGDEEAELLEFVRLNHAGDGALDRSELRGAAEKLVCWHPEWSDRRIAALCHLPPKAIAGVRAARGDADLTIVARVGRDGRLRPLDPRAQRVRIAEAIREQPDASLRAIAGPLGVSPETVRRVRAELMSRGELGRQAPPPIDVLEILRRGRERARPTWEPDRSFTSVDNAAEVAAFLVRSDTSTMDPQRNAEAIPLSRIYEVADEARRRAAFWQRFADAAERRTRQSTRSGSGSDCYGVSSPDAAEPR